MPRLKVTSPSSVRIEYEFDEGAVSIGREVDNMIVLDDPKASRYHAELAFEDGGWWLTDLDSTHGVWAQGKRVKKWMLKDRESFSIGDHKFRFTVPSHGGVAVVDAAASLPESGQRGKKQKQRRAVSADGAAAHRGEKKKAAQKNQPAPLPESRTNFEGNVPKPVRNEVEATSVLPPVSLVTDASAEISEEKAPAVVASSADRSALSVALAEAAGGAVASAPVITALDSTVAKKWVNHWVLAGAGIIVLGGAVGLFFGESAEEKSGGTFAEIAQTPPKPEKAKAAVSNTEATVEISSSNSISQGNGPAVVAKTERITLPAKELEMLLPSSQSADVPPALPQSQPPRPQGTPKAAVSLAQTSLLPEPKMEMAPESKTTAMAEPKVQKVAEARRVEKSEIKTPALPGAQAVEKSDAKRASTVQAMVVKGDEANVESLSDLSRELLDEKPDPAAHPPVLSPDLLHVLHLAPLGGEKPGLANLMLDRKVLREGIEMASAAELRFSEDGTQWMAFAADRSGRRALILPDRDYIIRGQLQAVMGSADFSVVAYVERLHDEDVLCVNGAQVSAYSHVTSPHLGYEGKHWAYIAVKQLDAEWEAFAPGERVVTDAWKGPIHDHISDLTLGGGGQRLAYVSHGRNGAQTLWLDRKAVCEVMPRTGKQISQLTFSPGGSRFAWVVLSKDGEVEWHVEDSPPLVTSSAAQNTTPTILSRSAPSARIIFSEDGTHVAFAAVSQSAVIALDGNILGRYPSAQADSLRFSPDGKRLAYVTLHPLRAADESGEGVTSQPHAAVLNVNAKAVHTVPVSVHKLPGVFPVVMGGLGMAQFSPDSARLAYLFTPPEQQVKEELRRELWVDKRKAWMQAHSVEAFKWLNETKLRLVVRRANSLWMDVLSGEN